MIKIICIGKIKEKFLKEAVDEYTKRITKYTNIQIIELPDVAIYEKALKEEASNILKHIKDSDYVITLEIDGNKLSSSQLSDKIAKTLMINSNIDFVIGGSFGLHQSVKERSDYALSFSTLTFPHQLFRVILLEQIYRSFKIINNESYNK